MPRLIALLLGTALLAIVQASFVAALSTPFSYVHLPLIHVINLVTAFRERESYAAALVAGLTLDTLSSLPFGSITLVLLAVTWITTLLFTRIFTHRSWLGTLGLNVVAFVLFHAGLGAVGMVRAAFAGLGGGAPLLETLALFGRAFVTQSVFVIVILAISGIVARSLSRRFIILR